ncbi:hypothetical protein FORMA_00510 [Formosa sp. Hel3_A1_48]|nr:hypothetical protein FORMA_00510 [Formosa sp. Hel3_A1_48]
MGKFYLLKLAIFRIKLYFFTKLCDYYLFVVFYNGILLDT